MKTKIILFSAAALALASCADLGYGIDSSGENSYLYDNRYYGNGYYWNPSWDNPLWNYGPAVVPLPPSRPPILNPGVGPAMPPSHINPKPERPARPPQINTNPGTNGRPSSPSGSERPGNMGRPDNNRRGN